jgi:osmotically-inducible protein OsmY
MRKSLHLLVFVLALALAYASAQSSGSSPSTSNQPTASPSQPSQDQTQKPEAQTGATATSSTDVQSQIQAALKNEPTLSNANITVSVTDDAVELSGTVASADEKRAAKKIAKSFAGNRKVKDSLTMSEGSKKAPPGAMSFASAGAYSQSQSTQPQQPQSGQSGTAQSPSTSQSPPTEPASSQQAPGATAAAASGDIQMQIQNALQKEPTLSNDNISVSVTDDAIELNGTVASGKEKQTAKRIAQSYAGNRKVKEHLTVKGEGSDNKAPDTNPTTPPSSTMPPDQNSTKPPSGSRPPRR